MDDILFIYHSSIITNIIIIIGQHGHGNFHHMQEYMNQTDGTPKSQNYPTCNITQSAIVKGGTNENLRYVNEEQKKNNRRTDQQQITNNKIVYAFCIHIRIYSIYLGPYWDTFESERISGQFVIIFVAKQKKREEKGKKQNLIAPFSFFFVVAFGREHFTRFRHRPHHQQPHYISCERFSILKNREIIHTEYCSIHI